MTDTTNAAAAAPAATEAPAADAGGNPVTNIVKAVEAKAEAVEETLKGAVGDALSSVGVKLPIFATHSETLAGELAARADGYKIMVADIDAKMDALQAERDDLTKAYNMLSAAMAIRVGTSNG